MNLERALSKLERNGFKHDVNGQRVTAKRDGSSTMIEMMLSEKDNAEKVVAVRTKGIDEQDDTKRNRFVGQWHDNLTQAIISINLEDARSQAKK